jgi:hypothetical protein
MEVKGMGGCGGCSGCGDLSERQKKIVKKLHGMDEEEED